VHDFYLGRLRTSRVHCAQAPHMNPGLKCPVKGKVSIAGQGYVELPIAIRAVEVGYDVVGYEPEPSRAKRLQSGSSCVEDVPDSLLAKCSRYGALHAL